MQKELASPVFLIFNKSRSLHATFLRNRIIGTMRASQDPEIQQAAARVPQNFIFDHPSLRSLSDAIATLIASDPCNSVPDFVQEIQRMVDHYTHHMPKPTFVSNIKRTGGIVVLLTGSTGNVGSHLLVDLLREPSISRVYTLNRGPDTEARQMAAFTDRNLPVNLLSSTKYVPLSGDAASESMGLDFAIFNEVRMSGLLSYPKSHICAALDGRRTLRRFRAVSRMLFITHGASISIFRFPRSRNMSPAHVDLLISAARLRSL